MPDATKVGSIFYESSLDPKGFNAGATQIKSGLSGLKQSFEGLSPVVKTVGAAFATYIGTRAVIGFFKSTIDSANESNRVMAQTNAVIQSTGGAAGYTTQQIAAMAAEIQKNTTVSDEAAQTGMNMLLTFTKIGSETFPQATRAMLDMATAMNGGVTPSGEQLSNTAIQLGKALQDPVLGVTALRRVGVNFTQSQIDMIKNLMDTNRQLDAQKFILGELSREFGGSATAQAQTFEGQMLQLTNQLDDFKENIGNSLIPALSYLSSALQNSDGAFGALLYPIRVVSTAIIGLMLLVKELGMVISAVFATGLAIIGGEANLIGDIWTNTMGDMVVEGANAQQKISQVWSTETTKQVGIAKKGNQDEESASGKKAAKIKKDLADETESYNDNLAKRNKAFDQSMADLIWAHQDKVKSLKKDLDDENKSFDEKMADQVKTYSESMTQMQNDHQKTVDGYQKDLTTETTDHATKVSQIQALIDQENSYGKNARQSKLAEYQQELADEMASYNTKAAEIQTKIDEENTSYADAVIAKKTANDQEVLDLQTKHSQQILDYQTEIDTEQGILNSHQTEVNLIKDKAKTDDITRLIAQHNEENIEADKQHQKKMIDIVVQGTAEGTASGAAFDAGITPEMEKTKTKLGAMSTDIGTTIAENLKQSAIDAGKNWANNFVDYVKRTFKEQGIKAPSQFVVDLLNNVLGGWTPDNSAGGQSNYQGGLSWVGEKGPELMNIPKGADVIPNDQLGGVGQTIIINVGKISNNMDIESIAREIGFRTQIAPR